jgi:hypothetical protein
MNFRLHLLMTRIPLLMTTTMTCRHHLTLVRKQSQASAHFNYAFVRF